VAIRTAVVDRDRRLVHYGVGSGIVADSRPDGEYAESLLKGRILEERPFELLETLAFLPGEGYRRLAGHLLRLGRSAAYFGAPAGEVRAAAEGALAREAFRLDALGAPARVRLLVDLVGRVRVEAGPHGSWPDRPLRVGLALGPVDSRSPWLRHKTTRREVYDEARRSRSDCDETLLFNERGEVTEACAFNVAVERGGSPGPPLVTPPLACGLLPGVEREALLAEGRLREQVVRVADLAPGQPLLLLNSVRGLVPATFEG
jgi:para-aminobenzoate synthetase/4-amino-4-deoxychorismate lyase